MTGPHLAARWATVYQQLAQLDNECGRNWFSDLAPVAFFRKACTTRVSRVSNGQGVRPMLLGRWTPIEPSSRPRPELFAELPLAGVLPRLRFRPRPMDPTRHPSTLEDAPRSLGGSEVSPAASVPNAATHPRAGHVAIGGIGDSPASLGAEALAPLFPPASRSAAASSGDSPAAQPSTNISPVENHGKPFIRHGEHRSLDVIWLGG